MHRMLTVRQLSSKVRRIPKLAPKISIRVHVHRSYDKPGAAADILGALKNHGLNLTHLVSHCHSFATVCRPPASMGPEYADTQIAFGRWLRDAYSMYLVVLGPASVLLALLPSAAARCWATAILRSVPHTTSSSTPRPAPKHTMRRAHGVTIGRAHGVLHSEQEL